MTLLHHSEMPISNNRINYLKKLRNWEPLMNESASDPLNEMLLNYGQVVLLFLLLVVPQVAGLQLIIALGVTEVAHYMDIFIAMAGFVVCHYLAMMAFAGRLVNRIDTMVYLKYLIVVAVVFWAIADAYLAYQYQDAFARNDRLNIGPRDIVWSDIAFEDLPDQVIYPNFRFAFMFALSTARALALAVIAYMLIADNAAPRLRTRHSKSNRRKKSMDELKANVHPSVLKKYKGNNDN